jgi:hypothetical protein
MDKHNAPEVARVRELLKTAIPLSGASNRRVERELGVSGGYLSRMFGGGIEFTVKHVLAISESIKLDPGEFFQLAYPGRNEFTSPTGKKLHDLVCRINGTEPPGPSPPLAPLTPERLAKMIRSALIQLFGELARS